MWDILPSWVKGTFEIISRIGHFLWVLFTAIWKPVTVAVAFGVALYDTLVPVFSFIAANAEVAWSSLTDAGAGMNAALAAGWPSQLASAVFWCNQWVPLAELVIMIASLMFLFVVTTTIRMVKSIIPTIAS